MWPPCPPQGRRRLLPSPSRGRHGLGVPDPEGEDRNADAVPNAIKVISSTLNLREDFVSGLEIVSWFFPSLSSIIFLPRQKKAGTTIISPLGVP